MRIQVCVAIAAVSFLMVGCGNGMTAAGSGGLTGQSVNGKIDMQKIQESSNAAQTAINNAQTALSSITDPDGSFKWSVLLSGTLPSGISSGLSTPTSTSQVKLLTDGIAADLAQILNQVVAQVQLAKDNMTQARTTLQTALAQVDPNSAEAAQINAMLTQLATMESGYLTLIHNLASQISIIITGINSLSGIANSFCPIPVVCGAAVWVIVTPIQNVIQEFQMQLMSL